MIGQLAGAQDRLDRLDPTKQQMFEQYLKMSDSEQAAVRGNLLVDYLNLSPHGRELWRRDAMVQSILRPELSRLDGLAQYEQLSEADKGRFRDDVRAKYRALPADQQKAWQQDSILARVMGSNWWLE